MGKTLSSPVQRIFDASQMDAPGAQPWVNGVFPGHFQFAGSVAAAAVATQSDATVIDLQLSAPRRPVGGHPPGTTNNPKFYLYIWGLSIAAEPGNAESTDFMTKLASLGLIWTPQGAGDLFQPVGHHAFVVESAVGVADDAGPIYSRSGAMARFVNVTKLNNPIFANLETDSLKVITRGAVPVSDAAIPIVATVRGAYMTQAAAVANGCCEAYINTQLPQPNPDAKPGVNVTQPGFRY